MLMDERAGRPAAFVMMTGDHPALVTGFAPEGEIGFADLAAAMLEAACGRRASTARGAAPTGLRMPSPMPVRGRRYAARCARFSSVRCGRRPQGQGSFRVAGAGDAPLLAPWTSTFGADIGESIPEPDAIETVAALTSAEDLAVWERDGEVVSMAAVNRRTAWSSNVAYVYTPPENRGRGYASAVVAALSQRELDAGAEWCCLFTDLANPTSNHIYAAIGYKPVCDYRHIELAW